VTRTAPGTAVRAVAAVALAAAVGSGVVGCSTAHHSSPGAAGATSPSAAPVARWWSNAVVSQGSTVDPAHPSAAAAALHPSQSDYCGMLSQTLAAGKSVLSTTSAIPLDTLEAFVTEISRVAPASLTSAWHTVGSAVVGYVRSGGTSLGTGAASAAQLDQAAAAISADASATCHLTLSSTPSPVTRPHH